MDVNFLSDDLKKKEEKERRRVQRNSQELPMSTPDVSEKKKQKLVPTSDPEPQKVAPVTDNNLPLVTKEVIISDQLKSAVGSADNSNKNTPKFSLSRHSKFLPFFRFRSGGKILSGIMKLFFFRAPKVEKKKSSSESSSPKLSASSTEDSLPQPKTRPVSKLHKNPWARVWYVILPAFIVLTFLGGVAVGLALIPETKKLPTVPVSAVAEPNLENTIALSALRDQLRLAHINLIQESLTEFWRSNAAKYPLGENVVLGAPGADCLSAAGWVNRDRCIVPPSPFENLIYLKLVPRDPLNYEYLYSSKNNGRDYIINFVLEVGDDDHKAGSQIVKSGGLGVTVIE